MGYFFFTVNMNKSSHAKSHLENQLTSFKHYGKQASQCVSNYRKENTWILMKNIDKSKHVLVKMSFIFMSKKLHIHDVL